MTTQANPFETLSGGAPENKDSENNSLGGVHDTPSTTYSLAKDSIPTDFIGRDGNYSKEEMLALFKPDYALPEEFVFHPMVMTKEAMQPVAFTPDEGRFSGKQSSTFQRGGRGGRGFSTRGGRGGPPRGRGGRGGKLEGQGDSKFSAFGREGEAGSWRDKRKERGEDDHDAEDEEYEYHEEGAFDKSTELSESKDDDWDEVKKKKNKKKKELDSSVDMKLRHSQDATKKDDVKKEVPTTDKPAASLDKPKPTIPAQVTPQTVAEKPAPAPTPIEVQAAPQLSMPVVQDALKQLEGITWIYKDSQGIDHGPYPSSKMNEWIMHNYLQADLILRKATDNKWVYLGELILMEQRNPFTGQALAEWVQSGTIPVLLHYQLLQLHQVLVQQQQQQHLPVNMQHISPLPFNYPNTQHANPSLDQGQPSAVALIQQLQHLAQQTSPAQQAGWQNQGWGSPSPQRVQQTAYPASPQPSQVHESGLTRKQGVFKIEDLEGSSAQKSQKNEDSPFSDLWGMNFGSLEKSGTTTDKSQQSVLPERRDDGNWETNKPKTKKPQPAQSLPTPPKKKSQPSQPQQPQVQSPPQQPIVSVVPAPWANAAQSKGTSIKSIQEEDYKDFMTRQQREQQEFEERFKQQQATQQRLATPWGSGNPTTTASGSSLSKIQEEEMRRKQEEIRRKEQERAGIVEPEPKANWAAKQKPVSKGKPNMREILEEEARERERQKRDAPHLQPTPQPKPGVWTSPEKSNMSVREILEEEERLAQMESQKKAQATPQPQQQPNNWGNKDSKKQSNYSANANDVPLREVQQQEFKHQQKQTQQQQSKGGNKKTQSLASIQQEQLKQRQIQSKSAPVQNNSAWKVNNGQAISMRDILRQEEAQKGRGSNTNSNQAADDDENFWDYNPNQEAANNNAPVVSADEFPALVSTVKKDDKIKQALGGKQQNQQAKGKKKGRSVDPNLLGFAAPSHEEQ